MVRLDLPPPPPPVQDAQQRGEPSQGNRRKASPGQQAQHTRASQPSPDRGSNRHGDMDAAAAAAAQHPGSERAADGPVPDRAKRERRAAVGAAKAQVRWSRTPLRGWAWAWRLVAEEGRGGRGAEVSALRPLPAARPPAQVAADWKEQNDDDLFGDWVDVCEEL